MSCLVKRAILQVRPVVVQQVRFRNRLNIQKPAPPHYTKLKVLEVTKPFYPKDTRPLIEKCTRTEKKEKEEELSPLDEIYAADMLNWTRHSKLVAVFVHNPLTFDEFHKAKILFFKANCKWLKRNKHIVRKAYLGTEYENLLCLTTGSTLWVFSPVENVKELMLISAKLPYMTLLAGVVEKRILSVSQLKAYSMLPDLETSRALLVQTLNSAAQDVVRGLNAHQTTLAQHLKSRIDQMRDSSSTHDTTTTQETEVSQSKTEAKVDPNVNKS